MIAIAFFAVAIPFLYSFYCIAVSFKN